MEVEASPLNLRDERRLYLVTFREYPEPPPQPAGDSATTDQLADELRRTREELRAALEEMQLSGEEQKAAHEEATSLNEELQSTNEELETSKEELQSLNEELVTVNAQLQTKMGELEATANDLGSLLASTDIAVLFLDPKFRIRRFTPALSDLIDLIPSDIGRPFDDLRLKFDDPNMRGNIQQVLDKLTPIERPVENEHGRHYLRRVLPYRTQDNRIDGVVITFVDVTERRKADAALRTSEERYRNLFESIDEGFCVIEMLYDANGRPNDYRFLEVNPAFERQTGLSSALGKRVKELVPELEEHWFEIYGRVAETGEPVRFVNLATPMEGRVFDVYATRVSEPENRKVAVLFRDITEQARFDEERERHVEQLKEAHRRKDEFLAMLAHELRNPLAAISNAAALMSRMEGDDVVFARDVIKRQVENLKRLIDDLLDVSRVSLGKVALKKSTLELGPICAGASELAKPLIEKKAQTLVLKVGEPSLRFVGDRTRVEQILGNLLSNASKYTEPGGHIELAARREDDEVVFIIKDDGIGIDEGMIDHVFDLFTQVDSAIDRSQGGLGIGLTLVLNLVKMHGGRVQAASEGLGKGSIFTVRLPIEDVGPEGLKS